MTSLAVVQEQPLGRRGPWFAAIWLFFLLDPLLVGWHERDTASGIAGMVLTVAFAACYMKVFIGLRRGRARLEMHPQRAVAVTWFAVLLALGMSMVLTLGQVGTTSAVYCAVAAMMLFPFRVAGTITLALAATVLVLGETVPGWDRALALPFATCAGRHWRCSASRR
jgi:two-component system sensor histidine kinase DesK